MIPQGEISKPSWQDVMASADRPSWHDPLHRSAEAVASGHSPPLQSGVAGTRPLRHDKVQRTIHPSALRTDGWIANRFVSLFVGHLLLSRSRSCKI